ncbi:MAG TPA: NADH-quinone oxidoreductase subunit C [Nitrososphaera sp.]|jgi:NADH-quinone oxidoreductase subunit C
MSSEKKQEKPAKAASSPSKPSATAKPPVPAKTTPPAAAKPPAPATPPAKKEPEPPAFEKGLADQISKKFGESARIQFIRPLRIKLQVDPKDVVEVATFLRDSMGFDHAESVAGTDYPKDGQIEVIYHLGSYTRDDLAAHVIALATRTSRDDARLPTLINVYKSVEYHERETFEMLGVYFEGHPRNDRFLLPEDWADIPPLRKDFRIKGR